VSIVRVRVPVTFSMPSLRRLGEGVRTVPAPPTTGTTVIADTRDLVLARWGVRLTHDGTRWQLRVPPHPGGEQAAPVEHSLPASSRTVPARAVHATRHLRRGESLRRVARLSVRRSAIGVVRDGEVLAHVSDEELSVHTGRRLSARSREVVLQPGPGGDDGLLAAVEQRILEAGALGRDDVPREVRVLGQEASAPPDLPASGVAGPAAEAWHDALVDGLRDLLVVGVHLRLDEDGRTAAPSVAVVDRVAGLVRLLDGGAAVRRGLEDLGARAEEVATAAARLALLDDELPGLRDQARDDLRATLRQLHDHLDSPAHEDCLGALRALVEAPGVTGAEASGTVRDSVAQRVGKQWAQLSSSFDPGRPAGATTLAGLASVARLAPGKAPRRFARAAARGAVAARAHAEAEATQTWCRACAGRLDPDEAFRAGLLAGRLVVQAADAIGAWDGAVERLTRERATSWLP
jgi:hypothetical protein